jgi:hypothetical protein
MGTWALIQVVFDIFAALGIFLIVMRLSRAPKDDPRLSRGLQLLQSKISVLEDLSDRTEQQVSQLTNLLELKAKEVQAKIQLADQHVHEIRVAMDRSLEVAKIFQDKIPHAEIIERQNTIKYVQAARLAHQGASVDEIASKVELPKGEIEFIAKVNRDRLMFNEETLPEWARPNFASDTPAPMQPDAAFAQSSFDSVNQNVIHEEPSAANAANDAERFRTELVLNEQQRLVENLSRLQFEMQNLDLQLSREAGSKKFESAFELPPKVETESIQKIAAEFRKACEDANQAESRSGSILPPLDHLTSLIPQIFSDAQAAFAPPPVPVQAAPVVPAGNTASEDPVLRKEVAQAKVRAALARARQTETVAPQREPSSVRTQSLEAARAMAKEITKPAAPVIRKVQFPRIESPE